MDKERELTKPGESAFAAIGTFGMRDMMRTGLTKREWFAGMCMSYLASGHRLAPSLAAVYAIEYTDALIKELNKGESNE